MSGFISEVHVALAHNASSVRETLRTTPLLKIIQIAHAFKRTGTEKPAPISMGPSFFHDVTMLRGVRTIVTTIPHTVETNPNIRIPMSNNMTTIATHLFQMLAASRAIQATPTGLTTLIDGG